VRERVVQAQKRASQERFGFRKSPKITETTPNLCDALNILGHHLLVPLKQRERFVVALFRAENETEFVDHVRVVGVELHRSPDQILVPIGIGGEVGLSSLLQQKRAVPRFSCERVNQGIGIRCEHREHVGSPHRQFGVRRTTELGVGVAKKAKRRAELSGCGRDAFENLPSALRVTLHQCDPGQPQRRVVGEASARYMRRRAIEWCMFWLWQRARAKPGFFGLVVMSELELHIAQT
jgi:hypothetical protein